MARFDRDGRPIPLDAPRGFHGRDGRDRLPPYWKALGDLVRWSDDAIGKLHDDAAKRGRTIFVAFLMFCAIQMAVALMVSDPPRDRPQRGPIMTAPLSELSEYTPQPVPAITRLDATRLTSLDGAQLDSKLRARRIEINGTVAAIELGGEQSDRVQLEGTAGRRVHLDVDAGDDPRLAQLSVGDQAFFVCHRGALQMREVDLFDCSVQPFDTLPPIVETVPPGRNR